MPGYRDPPVHSRFKPGQSGNPGGGPKGPRRKPVQRPSTYLDQKVTCTIGGKRFKGKRREAVVLIAALWSIKKPVPGSKARGATEQEKLPKPDLGLQQLLLKLMEQEDEKDRLLLRDDPKFVICDWPSRPDYVCCVEDAADVAGFGVKTYRTQKSARVLLHNRIIEESLARFGDRRLNREEQKEVLAATRFPKKVDWPSWWNQDLRERGKGWRAPQVARNVAKPEAADTIRISLDDYMKHVRSERLLREEIEYAWKYQDMSPNDQKRSAKPFERPGRPSVGGELNPMPIRETVGKVGQG